MATGCIYKVTCLPTGKSYIGQTRDFKMKAGRPYAYGVTGRWNDHVSCVSTTPLGCAIAEYGAAAFKVETMEADIPDNRLDEREAYWITSANTLHPNGYNKMRHGRCRHRDSSTLSAYYAPLAQTVRVVQVKQKGTPRLIYAYLTLRSGDTVRVVFGQGCDSTYASATCDAKTFLSAFPASIIEVEPRVFNPDASEFEEKLSRFNDRNIKRIRVAKFNSLAAVYVDKDRVCFGGKCSTYEESVQKALQFAEALYSRHPAANLINDASKSATGGCSSG